MDNRTLLNMHKIKTSRFGNADMRRQDESKRLRNERSARRTQNFNRRRNINELDERQEPTKIDSCPPVIKDAVTDRKEALKKYVLEREAIKNSFKGKQKPPFKVGIPHHGSSPILREITNQESKKKPMNVFLNSQKEVRVTRAAAKARHGNVVKETDTAVKSKKQKVVLAKGLAKTKPSPICMFPFDEKKTVFTFAAQKVMSAKKLTSPHTPTVLKRSTKKIFPLCAHVKNLNMTTKNKKLSTASTDSIEALVAPLSQAEEESSDNIQDQPKGVIEEPVQVLDYCKNINNADEVLRRENISNVGPSNSQELLSVHLTLNNSQHNQDKETKSDESGNGVEECFISPNVETKRGKWADRKRLSTSLSKPSPGHARESIFQRERLDKETRELLALVDKWELIALQTDLPQDIVDEIDSVVGLTRLLTRDKFNQFRGLIEQFEYQTGSPPVTNNDLNGFWDMIYLQVEPLIQKYTNLEVLKDSNWIQPDPPTRKKTRASKPRTNRMPHWINPAKRKEVKSNVGVPGTEDVCIKTSTCTVAASVPLSQRRSQSITSSPYIAMRLSGVGRSLGQSPIVVAADTSSTPKSILKKRVKRHEISLSANKTVLFNDNLSDELTGNHSKTPRRSLRIMGKTPTPANTCSDSNQTMDDNYEDPNKEENKPITSGKRFVLKRSTLVFNEITNQIVVPMKTRKMKRVDIKNSKELLLEKPENVTNIVDEDTRRRSSRKCSVRQVTFDPSTEEKCSLKLPTTPFRKSDGRKSSQSQESSDGL